MLVCAKEVRLLTLTTPYAHMERIKLHAVPGAPRDHSLPGLVILVLVAHGEARQDETGCFESALSIRSLFETCFCLV